MILLDTNVIIDMLNNEDDSRWNFLLQEECVICGVVISELYSGIRSKKEEKAIEVFVNSLYISKGTVPNEKRRARRHALLFIFFPKEWSAPGSKADRR